jgi:hypothetical protein
VVISIIYYVLSGLLPAEDASTGGQKDPPDFDHVSRVRSRTFHLFCYDNLKRMNERNQSSCKHSQLRLFLYHISYQSNSTYRTLSPHQALLAQALSISLAILEVFMRRYPYYPLVVLIIISSRNGKAVPEDIQMLNREIGLYSIIIIYPSTLPTGSFYQA